MALQGKTKEQIAVVIFVDEVKLKGQKLKACSVLRYGVKAITKKLKTKITGLLHFEVIRCKLYKTTRLWI
jgi:hypothetical protein